MTSCDLLSWRVWSAEHALPSDVPLRTSNDVDDLVATVTTSRVWADLAVFPHHVDVEHLRGAVGRSWYYRRRLWAPTTATIGLNPRMWWSLNILHELSHGAAPRFRYVDGPTPAWLRHQECHAHGPEWASTFLRLVSQFEPALAGPLQEAYEHYDVALLDDDGFTRARSSSHAAELELAQEIPDAIRSHALLVEQVEPTQRWERIGADLGYLLDHFVDFDETFDADDLLTRWQPLAHTISAVLPCTPDDIQDLAVNGSPAELEEQLGPARAEQLKPLALAALVALGVDPLYALSARGVLTWDAALPEWTAELNPAWYELLVRCHEQSAAMPSKWRLVV